MRTEGTKRSFKMDSMSLEALVQEVAREKSRKLVRAYDINEDKDPELNVDMWEELRAFLDKMKAIPLRKWTDIDRIKYGKAINYTKRDIISDHRLIISTTNTVVSEDIERCFGRTATGIIITQDAVVMEGEPNTWCPSIKLDNHDKVKAWIMFGDDEEPRPKIISPSRTSASKENISIPANPLFARLQNSDSLTIRLTEQNRMHKELAEWPNDRMYKGQLRNGKATHGKLDEDLAKLLAKYLEKLGWSRMENVGEPTRLHLVNVYNGRCKINQATISRYNAENVQVVMGFIKLLWEHKIIPRLTARLITPYHDQLRLYNSEYEDLERNGIIPSAELPVLSTIDGVQGREAQIVIFDSIVTAAECGQDLGLLMDDRRLNMVCSRAQEVFLLVGNVDVLSGDLLSYWDRKHRDSTPAKPVPYLLGLITLLSRRRGCISVDAKRTNTLPEVLETPGPTIRRLGGR